MLENRLPCTSHVCENRLPKMPSQELVGHTVRIRRITTGEVESSAVQAQVIVIKHHDFVVILLFYILFYYYFRNQYEKKRRKKIHFSYILLLTSGLTERRYWTNSWWTSAISRSPFCSELIFETPPGVSSMSVMQRS